MGQRLGGRRRPGSGANIAKKVQSTNTPGYIRGSNIPAVGSVRANRSVPVKPVLQALDITLCDGRAHPIRAADWRRINSRWCVSDPLASEASEGVAHTSSGIAVEQHAALWPNKDAAFAATSLSPPQLGQRYFPSTENASNTLPGIPPLPP